MKELLPSQCWRKDDCNNTSIVREEYIRADGHSLITYSCGDHYDPDWTPRHGYIERRVTAA